MITPRTMLAAVLALSFSSVMAGSLTPPGPPGPTMKPLDQVEPRIALGSAPIVISTRGSYYLTGNVDQTDAATTAIRILATEVTLDLNGFRVYSGYSASPAIQVAGVENVTIRNGKVISDGTAIQVDAFSNYCSLENLRVSGNNGNAINSDAGMLQVSRCDVSSWGGWGIYSSYRARVSDTQVNGSSGGIRVDNSSVVERCSLNQNLGTDKAGIRIGYGSQISDCELASNYVGIIPAAISRIKNCTITYTQTDAIGGSSLIDNVDIEGCTIGNSSTASGSSNWGIDLGSYAAISDTTVRYSQGTGGGGINVGTFGRIKNCSVTNCQGQELLPATGVWSRNAAARPTGRTAPPRVSDRI